eukprot:CAMPEP_0202386196 /NCGR_PEP_ID=MMETSP1127-20130417/65171_1 /ASSEMBLY_ACC=CAM_ASM_000462 /TAXON_ID=3047 /ORGANISM="Dunaliella tertiolecta, Strain CCMP1320" /LENGTH=256 /DNA_ID=CAMNT_0048986631 /DNA_START=395 /DNA_END=1167 /DNA_ORIENTATION=-
MTGSDHSTSAATAEEPLPSGSTPPLLAPRSTLRFPMSSGARGSAAATLRLLALDPAFRGPAAAPWALGAQHTGTTLRARSAFCRAPERPGAAQQRHVYMQRTPPLIRAAVLGIQLTLEAVEPGASRALVVPTQQMYPRPVLKLQRQQQRQQLHAPRAAIYEVPVEDVHLVLTGRAHELHHVHNIMQLAMCVAHHEDAAVCFHRELQESGLLFQHGSGLVKQLNELRAGHMAFELGCFVVGCMQQSLRKALGGSFVL